MTPTSSEPSLILVLASFTAKSSSASPLLPSLYDETSIPVITVSGAVDANISFVALDTAMKGDVNFNGALDENDLEFLYSVSSLQKYESYAISIVGDMNEDGAVDGLDAIILDLFLKEIPPSTLKGDANGDGKVDEADYILLTEITSCNEKIKNNFMFNRSDLNEDGAVDGFDVVYLSLLLEGLAI